MTQTIPGTFGPKRPFAIIRKWIGGDSILHVEYTADFWDGRRYVNHVCRDIWINGKWLFTARNFSYHDALCKSAGVTNGATCPDKNQA